MSDDRPAVRWDPHAKVWVIRASALGGCMKALIAAGRELEPAPTPQWMQEKFDEGHDAEPMIRDWYFRHVNGLERRVGEKSIRPMRMEEEDSLLRWEDGQFAVKLQVSDRIVVLGHVDDVGVDPVNGKGRLVEYKYLAMSSRPAVIAGKWTLPQYPWQISVYMIASGFSAMDFVTAFKPIDGDLTEPDWTKAHIRHINSPPRTRAEITARAIEIIRWIEEEPYGAYPECDVDMFPCPFYLIHDEKEVPELEGVEIITARTALDMLDEAKVFEQRAKDFKAGANNILKELLGDRKSVGMDGTRITWVHTEVPEKWITPKPYMKKASVTDYPKITPPKKTKDES